MPLLLRMIFPGILLEKTAKITRQTLPSSALAVLLRSRHLYVTSLRNVGKLSNFILRLRHGCEIAQP